MANLYIYDLRAYSTKETNAILLALFQKVGPFFADTKHGLEKTYVRSKFLKGMAEVLGEPNTRPSKDCYDSVRILLVKRVDIEKLKPYKIFQAERKAVAQATLEKYAPVARNALLSLVGDVVADAPFRLYYWSMDPNETSFSASALVLLGSSLKSKALVSIDFDPSSPRPLSVLVDYPKSEMHYVKLPK